MNEQSEEQLDQPEVDESSVDASAEGNDGGGDTGVDEGVVQPIPPVSEGAAADDSTVEDSAPDMPADEYAATVADDSQAESDTGEVEATVEEPAAEETVAKEAEPAPKNRKRSRTGPVEETPEDDEEEILDRDWYILKVQSNREKSIRDALERRVKIAGLERFFGEIIVPTEDVAEYKNGKRRVTKRKLWPGYIVVNMAINDDTWFLVRETPGIGDFTGSIGKPVPMLPQEVERIIPKAPTEEEEDAELKTNIPFKQGDRVRVKDGYFQNFEGDVETVDEANGRVTVMISVFGRSTPVELEHWHIEDV